MYTLRNKISLVGNLGKDVQLIEFKNGVKKAVVPLATSDYYTNQNGEKKEETHWHQLVAWGKLAERMDQKLAKGCKVHLEGSLKYRTFDDKQGQQRRVAEIIVADFVLINQVQKEVAPF